MRIHSNPVARMLPCAVLAITSAIGMATATAEDVPLADGTMWNASSRVEKTAYIVGASNFLTVEYVVQQKSGNPPTDEQSSVRRFWDGSDGKTINQTIQLLDDWYAANPDRLDEPVLVVLWNSIVEGED